MRRCGHLKRTCGPSGQSSAALPLKGSPLCTEELYPVCGRVPYPWGSQPASWRRKPQHSKATSLASAPRAEQRPGTGADCPGSGEQEPQQGQRASPGVQHKCSSTVARVFPGRFSDLTENVRNVERYFLSLMFKSGPFVSVSQGPNWRLSALVCPARPEEFFWVCLFFFSPGTMD